MNKCKLGLMICLFGTVSVVWSDAYTYPLSDVESLVLEGVDFEISCGAKNHLIIDAKSEDDFVRMSKGNKLTIRALSNSSWFVWGRRGPVSVEVTLLNPPTRIKATASEGTVSKCSWNQGTFGLEAFAGSDVNISSFDGNLAAVDIDASAGGEVELDGNMSIIELEVAVSSGASVELGGEIRAAELDLDASAGSDFESDEDQKIQHANINITSGATAEICGVGTLSGSVSSGGLLEVGRAIYPNSKSIDESSGGRVGLNCE